MDALNRSGQNPLEMQDTNFITLLKNPQKFKQTFNEMTNIASQSLKSQQYQKALKALNKCTDMLDLGKNILKDISRYWKLCIFANLACAYQGTWKMQKCNKFCEKTQQQLNRLLETIQSKQNRLNITKFQHCAILSQLNQHEKALEMCKSTLKYLEDYIRIILQYAQSRSVNDFANKSSETVQFSRQVSTFAEQILRNLLKNLTDPLQENQQKALFYYWQKNPQNNEDQVKKRFVSNKSNDQCKRSILGVNKMTHWIDQFNIGTIMHMSQLSLKDFQNPLPMEQYIFKDKLYDTVIYCSVAHFTIATEMRFIQSNKQKQKVQQPKPNQPALLNAQPKGLNINSIMKKYGFKQKSQVFKMSQLYHLRAIHIIAQNIKSTIPYISHLIKSYDKHYIYKKQLQPVVAIDEQSLLSMGGQLNQFKPTKQDKFEQYLQEDEQKNMYYAGEEDSMQIKKKNNKIIEDQVPFVSKHEKFSNNQSQEILEIAARLPSFMYEQNKKSKPRNKSEGKLVRNTRDKIKLKMQKIQQIPKEILKKRQKRPKQKSQKQTKQTKQGKPVKQTKKRKNDQIEGQVRINHQSCTEIKVVVFKKKK